MLAKYCDTSTFVYKKNTLVMWNFMLTCVLTLSRSFGNVVLVEEDICQEVNGRRLFLEIGESGRLVAKQNESVWKGSQQDSKNVSHRTCTLELITCPSCIIELKFIFLNITTTCGKLPVSDSCSCDYLWLYEPQYEEISGEQFCGHFSKNSTRKLTHESRTRNIKITFFYSRNHGQAFTLDYSSKSNKKLVEADPNIDPMKNVSHWITSPYFPHNYPADLSSEYIIQCKTLEKCRISLIFTDYRIAEASVIEIFDWNDQRMIVISGNIFRPPIVISDGPKLSVRFYANGVTNIGYKAIFTLSSEDGIWANINSDCGGRVNNLGGEITMINMTTKGNIEFDCIWILKPVANILHVKTHLYVRVVEFSSFGNTELTIRHGITSNGMAAEILRHPVSQFIATREEHVVPISEGFYISLRGLFKPSSRLAIVYAAFNYKECFSGPDFLCENLRCISAFLVCDGFDHCGDNSDEMTSTCSRDLIDRRQWSKIPNFLFPNRNQYSDITATTLVFLSCSFGFLGLAFGIGIYFCRTNTHTRRRLHIREHFDTINAILEESIAEVVEEIIIPDEPPDYEAPPTYDDILYKKPDSAQPLKEHLRCSLCNSTTHFKAATSDTDNEVLLEHVSYNNQNESVEVSDSPPPTYTSEENISAPESQSYTEDDDYRTDNVNSSEGPSDEINANRNKEIQSPYFVINGTRGTRTFQTLLHFPNSHIMCGKSFSDSELNVLSDNSRTAEVEVFKHLPVGTLGFSKFKSSSTHNF